MGVQWTKEQQEVIRLRDRNILVSAAAGSGKTAVLVERILSKITDKEHPVDIDRLLIMTFTRAAAGEMKERISAAIEKALCEDPDNERSAETDNPASYCTDPVHSADRLHYNLRQSNQSHCRCPTAISAP